MEERHHTFVCTGVFLCSVGIVTQNKPGVKESPIQQRSIVVVTDVVRHLHLSRADGGCVVSVDLDAVLWVPHVKQQDVKVKDGVGRDDVTW